MAKESILKNRAAGIKAGIWDGEYTFHKVILEVANKIGAYNWGWQREEMNLHIRVALENKRTCFKVFLNTYKGLLTEQEINKLSKRVDKYIDRLETTEKV